MNDTRIIEEQTKEELLKDCELSLEDLEQVSGGDSKTMDIQTIKVDGVTFNTEDIKDAPHKVMKSFVFTK